MPLENPSVPLPIKFIQALDIGKQSRAGALGLLAYDHFITIDAEVLRTPFNTDLRELTSRIPEVAFVWQQRKCSWSFCIYVFNRFFPIIWLMLDTIPMAKGGIVSSTVCIVYLSADDIVTLLVTIGVQLILQMRVYALYSLNKRLRYALLFACIAEFIAMVALVGTTMAHISRLTTVSTPTGCHYFGIISISAMFWVPALVVEPVLCALVIWKAWGSELAERMGLRRRKSKDGPDTPPMMRSMARDSVVYFIGTYSVLLVNTIIWAHFNEFINVIMPWSCALPSLLGSRMFLHMRELMLSGSGSTTLGLETFEAAGDKGPSTSISGRNREGPLEFSPQSVSLGSTLEV